MKKRKWSHFENENGDKSQTASVDGYSFGDRLLEGVMFNITIEQDGSLSSKVTDDAAGYMEDLNESKWNKEAIKFAENNDEFSPKDDIGDDYWLLVDVDGKYSYENASQSQAIPIQISTGLGISIPGGTQRPNNINPNQIPLGGGKSLEEILEDVRNGMDPSAAISNSTDETKDPNEDFSEYRMDLTKEPMLNPEENVVDYGVLMGMLFGGSASGVIQTDDKLNVSDDTKSKISDLLGDLDDDDDWMNE